MGDWGGRWRSGCAYARWIAIGRSRRIGWLCIANNPRAFLRHPPRKACTSRLRQPPPTVCPDGSRAFRATQVCTTTRGACQQRSGTGAALVPACQSATSCGQTDATLNGGLRAPRDCRKADSGDGFGPDARSRSGSDSSVVAAVLIELSGGEGVVRCDDGEIVLTHDVRLEWRQLLQPHDSYWWRMLASAGIIV